MSHKKKSLNRGSVSGPLSTTEIERLKEESLARSGRWEIAQVPDPVSKKVFGERNALVLALVVHQESYFIIATLVTSADAKNSCTDCFTKAIRKLTLPQTLVVRDPKLAEELKPLAEILDCEIEITRLKAIPEVLRGMTRILR